MKKSNRGRAWVAGTAAVLGLSSAGALAGPVIAPAGGGGGASLADAGVGASVAFRHEGVLGTSMELLVSGDGGAARACERAVLAEIERLRTILSTYDSQSEIRRVIAGGGVESPELAEVLAAYGRWGALTYGAIDVDMGGVIECWKAAARSGELPTDAKLRAARGAGRALNVDALGKGYVIDRAVAVARRFARAGLLNIGGDLRAWGDVAYTVGVADPACPAENAPPVATFTLREAAAATSGSYARSFVIGDRRYSHLIDPRTMRPVADVGRAVTAVAGDCVTANALATAGCVSDLEGVGESGMGHLIVGAGSVVTGCSGGFSGFSLMGDGGDESTLPARRDGRGVPLAAAPAAWLKDYEVALTLTFKAPRGGKVKRPYLAVWVEDAKGKVVRTVTVWGKQEKYLREMTAWWPVAKGDRKLIASVTRATRDAGKYTITWDGNDDAGAAVPQGDYTVVVEINREHGRHVGEKVKVTCGAKATTATLKATAESDEGAVVYGPKGKP